MSPKVPEPQSVLFYSNKPEKGLIYKSHLENSAFQLNCKESLESFFQERSQQTKGCALLDLENHSDLLAPFANTTHQPLSPLFLVSLKPININDSNWFQLADDYVTAPLSLEIFQKLHNFWMNSEPLFEPNSFKKLLQMNDDEFIKKILNSFNESLAKVYEKSLIALKEDNLLEISKACHSIKASAKMLGAQDLFHICQWIEFKKNQSSPMSQRFKMHFQKKLTETIDFFLKLSQTPFDKMDLE